MSILLRQVEPIKLIGTVTPHCEESFEPYSEEEKSEDDDYAEEDFYCSDDEDSAETNNMNDNIIRMIEGDWDFQ